MSTNKSTRLIHILLALTLGPGLSSCTDDHIATIIGAVAIAAGAILLFVTDEDEAEFLSSETPKKGFSDRSLDL